jgi:arylsulfatase A-like enzyme
MLRGAMGDAGGVEGGRAGGAHAARRPRARDVALAAFARGLVAAALIVLVPAAAVRRSLFYRQDVPLAVRAAAFAIELLFAALVLVVLLALHGLGPSRGPAGRLRAAAALLAAGSLATLYLASWGLYYGAGQFIGRESLAFASGNGGQLLLHFLEFNPLVVVSLPLAAVAAAAALGAAARRPLRPASRAEATAWLLGPTVVLGGLLTASALTLQASSAVHVDAVTGVGGLVAERHTRAARRESGPLTFLALDQLPEVVGGGERWPAPAVPIPELRRPRLSLSAYSARVPADAPRYDVLLVLVESLRADVLTALGARRVVMPNLEALTRESWLLANARAQASHSSYSDPTTLSGQLPLRSWSYRDYPNPVPYPRVLIYDLLEPRGYRSAIISSQNELWGGMLHFIRSPALDHLFHAETFHRHYVAAEDSGFAAWTERFKRSGKVDDADTVAELIRWTTSSEQPYFVYTNLQNSHFPYRYPEEGAPFQPSQVDFDYTFSGYPPDKVPVVLNRYHNALHHVDAQLGRVFDALRTAGRWERTIVVVTGDTGQSFYEHGRSGHGTTPYDELVRVPVVIKAPGLAPGVSERLSQQADIPPTLLALLGMPEHPAFQGRSALQSAASGEPVFTLVQIPALRELAVLDEGHKLIMDGEGKRELYDLAADPGERQYLWGRSRAVGARLENLLLSFRKAQLGYYADESRWASEYPPVLDFARR